MWGLASGVIVGDDGCEARVKESLSDDGWSALSGDLRARDLAGVSALVGDSVTLPTGETLGAGATVIGATGVVVGTGAKGTALDGIEGAEANVGVARVVLEPLNAAAKVCNCVLVLFGSGLGRKL